MLDPMPRHLERDPGRRSGSRRSRARAARVGGALFCLLALGVPLLTPGPGVAHEEPDVELEEVEEEIREHPEVATGYLHRAELQRTRRQWAAATADLQTAARLDPEMAVIDLSLAGLLLEANNPAPALEAVERYLARRPDDASAHLLKARILVRLGSRRPAIDQFTRGIDLARTSAGKGAQPDDYLQRARLQSCEGDEDDALRGIEDGLSQLGDAITLQLLAIDLELARSHWDAALARLAKIEAVARRKESWIARRAEVLAQAGRRGQALAAYAEAASAISNLPASLRETPATRELAAKVRAAQTALEATKAAPPVRAPFDWCAAATGQAM
jgi:tetratricopeptide (TPR) repeat protein